MDTLVLEEEKRLGVQSPALQKVKVSVEEPRVCAQGDMSARPLYLPARLFFHPISCRIIPHSAIAWGRWAIFTQGQERVRKTSLDLRREIIDVGGIQNLIELRKKRKQKKRDALAAAQEPPPEPEEIVRLLVWTDVGRGSLGGPEAPTVLYWWMFYLQTGPVDEETFLKAAVEGKMKVIDKYLADGGSADTCDEVRPRCRTQCPFRTNTTTELDLGSAPLVGLFEITHR